MSHRASVSYFLDIAGDSVALALIVGAFYVIWTALSSLIRCLARLDGKSWID